MGLSQASRLDVLLTAFKTQGPWQWNAQWDADLITDNYSTCICSVRMSNKSFFSTLYLLKQLKNNLM